MAKNPVTTNAAGRELVDIMDRGELQNAQGELVLRNPHGTSRLGKLPPGSIFVRPSDREAGRRNRLFRVERHSKGILTGNTTVQVAPVDRTRAGVRKSGGTFSQSGALEVVVLRRGNKGKIKLDNPGEPFFEDNNSGLYSQPNPGEPFFESDNSGLFCPNCKRPFNPNTTSGTGRCSNCAAQVQVVR